MTWEELIKLEEEKNETKDFERFSIYNFFYYWLAQTRYDRAVCTYLCACIVTFSVDENKKSI